MESANLKMQNERNNLLTLQFAFCIWILCSGVAACAPRVVQMQPKEGAPGTVVSLSMKYLVGWPRVELGGHMMDFYQLKLLPACAVDLSALRTGHQAGVTADRALSPERKEVPGEEITWIEDKILQFRIPDLPPGDYTVTIHDDKGPPGDNIYAFLETTAYLVFPPVWPFVFRSNETQVTLRVLPP